MPQSDLRKHLAECTARRRAAIWAGMQREAVQIRTDLIEVGPVDTGIARGEASGAPVAPTHKGAGLAIGNEPGESGWQIRPGKQTATEASISIGSPLWESYLKWVETGWIHARSKKQIPARLFLATTWRMHLSRSGRIYG